MEWVGCKVGEVGILRVREHGHLAHLQHSQANGQFRDRFLQHARNQDGQQRQPGGQAGDNGSLANTCAGQFQQRRHANHYFHGHWLRALKHHAAS